MDNQTSPYLYTVKETMAELRIGRTKAYELIAAGKLAVVKFGHRTTRIKAESIRKLIADGVA
jgi:excisionase family DNA binding protein